VTSPCMDRAADTIACAERVVVLTGAGVSKESGIPTFRDAQTGLWAKYNPEELATPQGFLKDPQLVWQWYDYRRRLVMEALPNPGHLAIYHLEKVLPVVVVTQNVDGLHKRAGSSDIIELHGSILRFFCFDEHHSADNVECNLQAPPLCACGSLIRPAVVWFNETLPPDALQRASELVMQADVVLVIGTSGLVQPAASLPWTAKRHGAKVIEVNPDRTPISDLSDIFLAGPAGVLLPQLVQLVEDRVGKPTS